MSTLIALVSGLSIGVWVRSTTTVGWPSILFVLLLAMVVFFVWRRHPRRSYACMLLFLICLVVGGGRMQFADTPPPSAFMPEIGKRVAYTGYVIADPDLRDARERVEVRVTQKGQATNLLVVAPREVVPSVGDTVWVSGTLTLPKAFASDGGRVFRYDQYLKRDGVRFLLNYAVVRLDTPAPWYNPFALLAKLKHFFIYGLDTALPEPYASLAGGVVIGGKSGLGNDLQDAFVRSGLIQIIVLSGYNVMVVAEWLMALGVALRVSRKTSVALGAVAIVLFVGVAGASATAVRAMLMALIALFARATGRTYAAGRALFVAVGAMVLWNPFYLVFDPGFELSVVATAGLIWLAPHIEAFLARKKRPEAPVGFWKNAVATTLAAQIAVLPLLLYQTGNLSFVAIPATLLTLPVVPLSMGFSALAGVSGMVFGQAAQLASILFALPAYVTNAYLLYVAQTAARLPFAAIILPAFSGWLVLLAYLLLGYAIWSKRASGMLQFTFARKASM